MDNSLSNVNVGAVPHLAHINLVVRDYDEALAFYVGKLGFNLVEDSAQPEQDKRWVVIRPPGAGPHATTILLARAATPEQAARVGDQTGAGRRLPCHRRFRPRPCPFHRRGRDVGPAAGRPALWPRRGVCGPLRQSVGPDRPRAGRRFGGLTPARDRRGRARYDVAHAHHPALYRRPRARVPRHQHGVDRRHVHARTA
ncbi:VOC family protein [Roseomonas aeriglobus]|nr:VOC family protein [Roseomonas aeriglobus]